MQGRGAGPAVPTGAEGVGAATAHDAALLHLGHKVRDAAVEVVQRLSIGPRLLIIVSAWVAGCFFEGDGFFFDVLVLF